MYSTVNEFEECRAQALTLTKRLNYLEGLYEGLRNGLEEHGHSPTQMVYTDNASGNNYTDLLAMILILAM